MPSPWQLCQTKQARLLVGCVHANFPRKVNRVHHGNITARALGESLHGILKASDFAKNCYAKAGNREYESSSSGFACPLIRITTWPYLET